MRTIKLTTPKPPDGTTFAAVQIEASRDGETWRIVGAESARDVTIEDGRIVRDELLPAIHASCKLTGADKHVRAIWVCEDTAFGTVTTEETAVGSGRRWN